MKKSVLVVVAGVLVLGALGFMSATGSFAPTKLASQATDVSTDGPDLMDVLAQPTIQSYSNSDWSWENEKILLNNWSLVGYYTITAHESNSITPTAIQLSVEIPDAYKSMVTNVNGVYYYLFDENNFADSYVYNSCESKQSDTGFSILCPLPEGSNFIIPQGEKRVLFLGGYYEGSQMGTLSSEVSDLVYKEGTGFSYQTKHVSRTFENLPTITIAAKKNETIVKNGTKIPIGSYAVTFSEPDHPYSNPYSLDSLTLGFWNMGKAKIKNITVTDGKKTASCIAEFENASFACDMRKFDALKPGSKKTFKFSATLSGLKEGESYALLLNSYGWNPDNDPISIDFSNSSLNFALSKTNKTTQCSDSDGGKVYTKKGVTKFVNAKDETVRKTDTCANMFEQTEYYCKGDSVASVNKVCPGGCDKGVCANDRVSLMNNMIRK